MESRARCWQAWAGARAGAEAGAGAGAGAGAAAGVGAGDEAGAGLQGQAAAAAARAGLAVPGTAPAALVLPVSQGTWAVGQSLCHHLYHSWALKCRTWEVVEVGNGLWKEPPSVKPSAPFCRIVRWRAAALDGIETDVYRFSFYIAVFSVTS